MKNKSTALIVALLLLLFTASILWFQKTPEASGNQITLSASEPTDEPTPPLSPAFPPDAEEALRLSPPSWSPPAAFAQAGIPTPQIPFPRGENSQRRYADPETNELPRDLRTRVPSVLAKTPADGRLHLLPEEIDLHTRLARRMVFDPTALDHIIAGNASRLIAPTTGDEVLTLEFHAVKTRSPHTHTLLGRVVGEEEISDVIVVYHDGVIHGSIARYAIDINQHLEYRILADGHMMVRELDPTTMTASCGNNQETHMADPGAESLQDEGFEIIPQEGDGEVIGDTAGWRTVDVVVGYDQGARIADGGYPQIEARIIASVDRMTSAFANSLVSNTEVMLLGTIEDPDYAFPGTTSGSQLDELQALNGFTDGVLDTVSNYYTMLGADLIAFIPRQADGSAGLAYLPGRASITARDYMTSTAITFAHELGHNLGADHSWGDSSQAYHTRYGWRLDPPNTARVRTIMAYDWGWGNRIPYYSNPSVSFNGARTGAVSGYNVQGDATADQRYYQGGLGYSGSDPNRFGFNGANSGLAANNANTIDTGAGNSNYGATFASNRGTRTTFNVTSPVAGSLWERGQTMGVFFRGGDMKDLATIELFKGGLLQSTLATNLNPATHRNFPWTLPSILPAGADYMLRVTLNPGTPESIFADSGIFTVSGGAPYVVSHTPAASPAVSGPVSQIALTFSQPMNPASFSIGDDILSFSGPNGLALKPTITGGSWSGGNTVLTIQFSAQSQGGFYRMILSPEIADTDGKFLDQNLNDVLGESLDDRYIAGFEISGGGGGTVQTIWQDLVGADSPDAGWSFSGTNSSWQTGTPTSNPNTSFDGAPIIAQNLAGDYNVLENSYAQSPIIDCSAHTDVTLSFRGWKGAGRNDTLYVDAWNGSSWQRVYTYTGPNGGANDTSWTLYQPALGTHGDLNPNFQLRWGLVDVTNQGSSVQTGWQLDAIVVQGTTESAPAAPWVTAHWPDGSLEDPQSSIWIEFSNPMDTGSFSLGDIASFTGPFGSITANGFQWQNPYLLRIDFPEQFLVGTYNLLLAPTLLDVNGLPLDQDFDGTPGEANDDAYLASFQIGSDAGPVAYFAFNGIPSEVNYNTTIHDVAIIARDADGKIASTFTSSVTFGGTAGITGTTANFTSGVLTDLSLTLPLAGTGLTITVDNGEGQTGTATLNVIPESATIEFDPASLSQTYDGTPRAVVVTTNPAGLDYAVSYQGEPDAPINAGGYEISAAITNPNYQGSASDILIVAQAAQSITFAPLGTIGNDVASIDLTATSTSELPISYTSSQPSIASVSGSLLTLNGAGTTTITASQPGNGNYLAAAPVARDLTIVRVNPVAAPGGPYKLLFGQALTLDGSASEASEGESLTNYQWDLNNDATFGDAIGATPASIPFATLTSTWGLSQGINTIRLRVTDSAGKTSTAAAAVEIVVGLTWDANGTTSGQTDGAGVWLAASRWWDGSANTSWISGSNATFGNGGTGGAVTLASPTSANAITLNTYAGTYTLGSAGQAITLNDGITKNAGSGAATFLSGIQLGGSQVWLNESTTTLTTANGANLITTNGYPLTIDGSGAFTFGVINNVAASITGSGDLVKNGSGVLAIGGENPDFTGNVTVNGGLIRVNKPASITGNLNLINGVYEHYWTEPYTRSLGTGANHIQLTGGTSGFSMNGNSGMTVTLNNDANYEMQWGSDFFSPSVLVLQADSAQAASTLTFANRIDFNGANRTIHVSGGTTGAARASITGQIRNSSGTAGFTKTGAGILSITNASSGWNGATSIQDGILDFTGININTSIGQGTGVRDISLAAGTAVRFNAVTNAWLNRIVQTTAEVTVMTANTAQNLNFNSNTGANLPNGFLGNWAGNGAKTEYSGTLTPASDAYRLGGKGSSGLLGIVGTNKLTGTQGLIVGATGASGIRVELAGANNFSGETIINSGAKLTLGNDLALQNSALNVGSVGGNFALSNGLLSGRITGSSASPSPTFGGLIGSRNLITVFSASGGNNEQVLAATAVTGFTLNPGAGKSHIYSGAIGEFATATTLTKTGTGTQILNGANTYTGSTTISNGKLFLNGSTAGGAVAVHAGATLGGTGTIGGNTTVAANGAFEFHISTPAASHAKLTLASGRTLTFAGASALTITSNGGASPGTYTLVTAPGGITGSPPATLNLPAGWSATTSIVGNNLVLNLTSTAVGSPGSLAITPGGNFASSGMSGGPFLPETYAYTLHNPGTTSVSWTSSKNASWVSVTPTSGTLGAGASVTVTCSINGGADFLSDGTYHGTVTFTNLTNGLGNTTRGVTLSINDTATSHFLITGIPAQVAVGSNVTGITISARTATNQTATAFTGTVTFGGTAGITGMSASFVGGVLENVSITPAITGSGLTFTVNNGGGQTGTATFDVTSAYEAWAAGNFANPLLDSDPDADPDGDGFTNLQEFAFGTDPTAGTTGPIVFTPGGAVTQPGAPAAMNLLEGGGVDFRAVFGRRSDYQAIGLTYSVQFSADLVNWLTSNHEPSVLSNGTGPMDAVSVPYPFFVPVQGGFKKPNFFRVGVTMD